jgi:hypothetical protein
MRRALVHSCLGNNRLVRSSSPPSPTTQSCANGDFPVQCESPDGQGVALARTTIAADLIHKRLVRPFPIWDRRSSKTSTAAA